MKFACLSAALLIGSVVGCGGGDAPKKAPPTPAEQTEIKAMHDSKAAEAAKSGATTPPNTGGTKP